MYGFHFAQKLNEVRSYILNHITCEWKGVTLRGENLNTDLIACHRVQKESGKRFARLIDGQKYDMIY